MLKVVIQNYEGDELKLFIWMKVWLEDRCEVIRWRQDAPLCWSCWDYKSPSHCAELLQRDAFQKHTNRAKVLFWPAVELLTELTVVSNSWRGLPLLPLFVILTGECTGLDQRLLAAWWKHDCLKRGEIKALYGRVKLMILYILPTGVSEQSQPSLIFTRIWSVVLYCRTLLYGAALLSFSDCNLTVFNFLWKIL